VAASTGTNDSCWCRRCSGYTRATGSWSECAWPAGSGRCSDRGSGSGPLLLALWTLYLSLASVAGDFLWFQWDGLLLETAIVAALVAPWRRWSRLSDPLPPPRAAVWLVRWLLFRLVFSSAVVKLASGDPTWRSLTALSCHYETQPLPPWTAWYAHQLPGWFQNLSTLAMFGIEGLVPFLVFAPRRPRFFAAGAIAFLQVLILVTGNYGIFNWLTLVLCIVLLDDAVWPSWLRRWAGAEGAAVAVTAPREPPNRRAARWAVGIVATSLFVLGLCPLLLSMRVPRRGSDRCSRRGGPLRPSAASTATASSPS